jgi:lipopolysaccharide/colanic/teichoic acid biosynthesis glycosyltransferase
MDHTKIITRTESYPVAIINPGGGTIKRAFDIILSGIGIVVFFPVWVFSSIAIIMESGGPIFISQERVGKDGWIFHILKFRSMDKEAHKESPVEHAGEREKRITRVGKVLRSTAMDELPQLLSIFKGDMSFVGPRPVYPKEPELNGSNYNNLKDIPNFDKRCSIKPGLTGLAQVYVPKEMSIEKKIKYDILYIKKQSFLLDLKLILLSFLVTARVHFINTLPRICLVHTVYSTH